MKSKPEQRLFSFLAEDPVFLASKERERAVNDILERLEPALRERLDYAIKEQIDDYIHEVVLEMLGRFVNEELRPVADRLDKHLQYHRQDCDSADWWKQGREAPDLEEGAS